MSRESHSQPSGVVIIQRLPASSRAACPSQEPNATLAEFLAYLTEPDATQREGTPARPTVAHVNRLRVWTDRVSPNRLPAELPKLASELDDAWRELRRRIALAARLTA